MGRVHSHKLNPGTRIGSYEIDGPIGRGYEGEVYAVHEVPTDAERAMKIVRHEPGDSVRDRVHAAWYFEQLADTGAVARYYHMGQWFFGDDHGVFYYVFERLPGENLHGWLARRKGKMSPRLALGVAVGASRAISRIHGAGYAVGDFETGENLIINKDATVVKVCDCDPGVADRPNADFKGDVAEFKKLLGKIFGGNRQSGVYRTVKGFVGRRARQHNARTAMGDIYKALKTLHDDEVRALEG